MAKRKKDTKRQQLIARHRRAGEIARTLELIANEDNEYSLEDKVSIAKEALLGDAGETDKQKNRRLSKELDGLIEQMESELQNFS